jgi:hypothetical protein
MKGLVTVDEIPPAVNLAAEYSIAVLKSAYDHPLPGGESVSRGDSR